MTSSVLAVVVDCHDVHRMAEFWSAALSAPIVAREPDELMLVSTDDRSPVVYFMRVPEPKTIKNRLHLDLVTDDPLDREVMRLVGLGAQLLDVRGDDPTDQHPDHWAVLTDPEGNEFCVTSRDDLTGWPTSVV